MILFYQKELKKSSVTTGIKRCARIFARNKNQVSFEGGLIVSQNMEDTSAMALDAIHAIRRDYIHGYAVITCQSDFCRIG